ncbi:hypothetical protein [Streptomyces lydicus]|uniref:hypothetical protein n=1 Tax=Streptomyces lydicus TaxID=47763 RepID=UPI0036EC2883
MIQILPIGTPVWVAQAACPDGTRRALCGDGVVTALVCCVDCHNEHVGGRHITPADYRVVAAACRRPSGYVATVRGIPVTVTADDDSVLAVPITSDERSAA